MFNSLFSFYLVFVVMAWKEWWLSGKFFYDEVDQSAQSNTFPLLLIGLTAGVAVCFLALVISKKIVKS